MKAIKKIILIILSVTFVLSLAGILIVTLFEEEIKNYAVKEISKQLKTDIKVKEVSLTLWGQFPSASLQFTDVMIQETFEKKDTLIYAENVYLNFSVSDFISGRYEVKEVTIENSAIHLKKKASGEDNYHFWKESEGDAEEFSINLSAANLKNTFITLDDKHSKVELEVLAKNSQINGDVGSQFVLLSGDLISDVRHLKVDGKSYLNKKLVSGTVNIEIDLKDDLYTFKECDLSINELPLNINGTIDINEYESKLDLIAKSKKADLSAVIKNLPSFIQQQLSSFQSRGEFQSVIAITGGVSSKKSPAVNASFKLSNGNITNSSSGIELKNISTSGTYKVAEGREDLLLFDNLSCTLGSGDFNASGKISRLSNPFINGSIDGKIQLDAFSAFFNLTEIESMSGLAEVSLNYKGNFGESWKPSAASINKANVSGTCQISQASIKLHRNPHIITEINGSLNLKEGNAYVPNLTAKVDQSDFKFTGEFNDLVSYMLVKEQKLAVNANLTCAFLDLNSLLSSDPESEGTYNFSLPSDVELSLNTNIDQLVFRAFLASAINTKVYLNNKKLKISPLEMKTSEGSFNTSLTFTQKKNGGFLVESMGTLKDINITQLFASFENFGQGFITDKHLKGNTACDFSFSASMSEDMKIDQKSILVEAELALKNGELIGQSSLIEMGDFLVEKKLVSAITNVNSLSKKLNHVRFSELSNTIIIKNETVHIPKMTIYSDVLNIKAEGSHKFNNQIAYSIGFDLADLSKREGLAEDEKGLSKYIFISMDGTTTNPEFGYDKLAIKEQRQESRQEEKVKIKSLIKDEFSKNTVSATNDSISPQQEQKSSVTIEWNDTPEEKQDAPPEKDKTPQEIINNTPSEDEDDDDF
ncbi:MAG TPA: hypothetical protein DHU89_01740 [Flavobacteriales bacterium]|nr:hypothetical protein [Flavobacteriales bacterium]